MSEPEYNLNDIISNAYGEKPLMVQKAFNNAIVQKAADIIAGKREEIAAHYGAAIEKEVDNDDSLSDISDEELDKFIEDEETDLDDPEDDLLSDEDLEDLQDDDTEE